MAPQTMNDVEKLYDQYGDKIVLAIFPPEKDLAERNEEEQARCGSPLCGSL
jgi:hypothetical protein